MAAPPARLILAPSVGRATPYTIGPSACPRKKLNAWSENADALADGASSVTSVCTELCSRKKPKPSTTMHAICVPQLTSRPTPPSPTAAIPPPTAIIAGRFANFRMRGAMSAYRRPPIPSPPITNPASRSPPVPRERSRSPTNGVMPLMARPSRKTVPKQTKDRGLLSDWGPEPLLPEQARDLLEIVEDRYDAGSLLITSQ